MSCNRNCLNYNDSVKRVEYIPTLTFKERMKIMKLYNNDLRNKRVKITNNVRGVYIEFIKEL